MDERTRDQDAVVAVRERRHLAAPEAPAHLPRTLSCRPPRSHLLRRQGRSARRGNAAHAQGADGIRPPAARRDFSNRLMGDARIVHQRGGIRRAVSFVADQRLVTILLRTLLRWAAPAVWAGAVLRDNRRAGGRKRGS